MRIPLFFNKIPVRRTVTALLVLFLAGGAFAQGTTSSIRVVVADLDGIAVSSGSACSSGKVAASPVLAAMGVAPQLASCAIRVSLGWNTTVEDINRFIGVWKRLVDRHKQRPAA